jgi:hypothetical protein
VSTIAGILTFDRPPDFETDQDGGFSGKGNASTGAARASGLLTQVKGRAPIQAQHLFMPSFSLSGHSRPAD